MLTALNVFLTLTIRNSLKKKALFFHKIGAGHVF